MEHARPPPELSTDGSPVSRADAWKRWKMQFNLFLKASGVFKEESAVQASLLINLIGPEGFDAYQTFVFEKETEREDVAVLLKKFDGYFGVKPNITLARYNFFMRNQEEGESINQYVTALKLLSKNCEFSSLQDDLIRDRIVCGIRSTVVRDRLLRTDDLNLDKALKVCLADELSVDSTRRLDGLGNAASPGPSQIDALQLRGITGARGGRRWRTGRGGGRGGGAGGARARTSGGGEGAWGARAGGSGGAPPRVALAQQRGSARLECLGCGKFCDPGMCPAIRVQCFVCQGYGHFARMCANNIEKRKMYDIAVCDQDSEAECESFFIPMISDISNVNTVSAEDWYETLIGLCGEEKFKLDTGADINVLSYEKYLSLGYNVNQIVEKPKMKLLSYSGNIIPIKGVSYMKWWFKNKVYNLKFAIADINCESVLGRNSCTDLGLIVRLHTVNIAEYSDLFEGLGCLPGRYHIVVDESIQPVISATRKVPIGLRDKLLEELNRMTELGVIRKVSHPTRWVNALVIAAKKNGSLRICLDPRPLNCAVQRAHFQLPTINELAAKLHGAKYFSVLDANSGFWATQLDDASADLCTFSTPFGRYQFLRLPYGLNCASEVFHATIKQLLENLDGTDSFIDDIICWGRTKQEHDERLNKLLRRAREINLKFNKEKCKLCVEEVTYLGHVFNKDGMKPDSNKIVAIKNMPAPHDKKSLERFLGAVNYLSKFIPNYSEHIYPLTRLLKKDSAWCWESVHEGEFKRLKELLCNAPVLALFDATQPVVVSVDASSVALGAVLLQGGRPVEYASRTLTDTQSRYAQIEKELLAIVFACEKYHQYIYGQNNVTVETDHKPLESIFKKPLDAIPVRLQRMLLRLQGYDLQVNYKPGKYMFIPDTLSRAPLKDLYNDNISKCIMYQVKMLIDSIQMSEHKLKIVKDETNKDKDMCQLINYIDKGWPENKCDVIENLKCYFSFRNELCTADGIVFKNQLVLIPASLRSKMLNIIHDGHQGVDRCKRRAREVLFWPGITRDIEQYVKRCTVCQECQNAPAREPMLPVPIPSLPWNKLGTDIFEYRKKYYLIIVDYYSGFIEVASLKNITSDAVIMVMKENFARYGIPQIVISDNAGQFTSRDFRRFACEWGFEHVTSSPHYAQSNGKSERAVQSIKKLLIKSINSGSDFYLHLLSCRNTPRENIGSPAQLLMGRRLNCRLPVHHDLLKPVAQQDHYHRELVQRQIKSKAYYDRRSRNLPKLNIDDDVIIMDHTNVTNKMRGKVVKIAHTPRSYIIKNRKGIQYRRNRRHLLKCETKSAAQTGAEYVQSKPEGTKVSPADVVAGASRDAVVVVEPTLTRNKAKKLGIDINSLF